MVGLAVAQRVAEADAREDRVEPHVEAAQRHADARAEARPQRLDVAHGLQVARDRAVLDRRRIGLEPVVRAAGGQRLDAPPRPRGCPTGSRCGCP